MFDRAVFTAPGKERILHMFDGLAVVHAKAAETGGAMGIVEGRVQPRGGPQWHTHTREDEVLTVLTGRFRFWCGDDVYEGGPGTTIVLPKNVRHRWVNCGETWGNILITAIPGGFEEFFYELAALNEPSREALWAIEEKYGITDRWTGDDPMVR
jgi:quercetin dioxygenase-like cupin family protein